MKRIQGSIGEVVLFGVPVRFHFTFLFVVALIVAAGLSQGRGWAADALFLVALFASVLFHELGHALVARAYGIQTLEIVMLPIGGVARLEKQPAAWPEFWIALAGPAVNGVIGGLLLFGRPALDPVSAELAGRIGEANLYLAAFNLIPAFPMDGGRIMRALLSLAMGEDQATLTASRVGRTLAVMIGLYGILNGQIMLLLIAFLIYMAAYQEGAASEGRALTHGVPVSAAMMTEFHTLAHGSTMKDAADLLLACSQQDFPVVHGDQVVGLLDRTAFIRGLALDGPDAFVSSVMNREFVRLDPDLDLAEALASMADAGSCALVMRDGALRGLLTTENISEFLLLRKLGLATRSTAPAASGTAS